MKVVIGIWHGPKQRVKTAVCSLLVLGLCLAQGASATPEAQEQSTEPGHLQLVVMVVASDLSLRPVPKWAFIVEGSGIGEMREVTTSFEGKAEISLPPGIYEIRSRDLLPFEDHEMTWKISVEIRDGETTVLELSNDNASIADRPIPRASVDLDEGDLYRRVKNSVFKVLSESGHGSGFLIDSESGLIVTNHHVVSGSDYLAVLIDTGRKHKAKLIEADPVEDIAVIQVHPSVVAELVALELARDEPAVPSVSVGETVVAVGSPLATETILTSGLVSKVEKGAIYSDVNINPGSSGGPLFSLRGGQVVGINTFGVPTGRGPGVSGIVRIHLARSLIARVLESDLLADPPDATPLPVEADFSFPASELRAQAMRLKPKPKDYHLEVGKFDLQVVTPVLSAYLEVEVEAEAAAFREKRSRGKKVKKHQTADHFYEWRKYVGKYRPVVTLHAIPEIRLTGGSIFAAVLVGASAPQKYRFKADFDRMVLERSGVEVQPIHPGRYASVSNFEQGLASMKDVGYYGMYKYPPEAFKPGAALSLKLWKQGVPTPIVKVFPAALQARIWEDFRPYFEALEAAARN